MAILWGAGTGTAEGFVEEAGVYLYLAHPRESSTPLSPRTNSPHWSTQTATYHSPPTTFSLVGMQDCVGKQSEMTVTGAFIMSQSPLLVSCWRSIPKKEVSLSPSPRLLATSSSLLPLMSALQTQGKVSGPVTEGSAREIQG